MRVKAESVYADLIAKKHSAPRNVRERSYIERDFTNSDIVIVFYLPLDWRASFLASLNCLFDHLNSESLF